MCNLSQQKFLGVPVGNSRQKISNFSTEHKSLKEKNDKRAFALLKALSAYQTSPTRDLSAYPTLSKYLTK
jgi:hypothetical protein